MKLPLTKLTGLNWYKWGAYALVLAIVIGTSYGLGYHKASVSCEKEKAALATKQAEVVTKYVTVRVPEVQVVEKRVTEVKWKTRVVKETLHDTINQAPARAGCALSDSERVQWNKLTEATR